MRLIDADVLLEKVREIRKLALDRAVETPANMPFPIYQNPAYTRYSTQADEREKFKVMIEEAPSAQPERKEHGCEYCCEDSDGYILSIEKNGHAYIQNGKLALRANGWWGECAINFCPMCGRKLRGEQE